MLYDEQPVTFKDSWNQRFRWAKGFYQVFGRYGWGLAKGIFTNPKGRRFACFDMLMTIAPGMLLTIVALTFNTLVVVFAAMGLMSTGVAVATSVSSVFFCVFNYTLIMFAFGVLATFTEWDNINAPASHKIGYMFTFPAFMLTYIPIALVALVKKAEWKPIAHTISVDVESLSRNEGKIAA
jgi:cellulose synthase/poly-beta-1,6-N-acetylglucosamine synthase-like glycosyltransferase